MISGSWPKASSAAPRGALIMSGAAGWLVASPLPKVRAGWQAQRRALCWFPLVHSMPRQAPQLPPAGQAGAGTADQIFR